MDKPQQSHRHASEVGRIDLFLSRKIVDVRETKSISFETLATLTGTSADMLAEYEAGVRKIPSLLLFKISQTLGVTLSEIFSDVPAADPSAPVSQ